jgi:hypothetical protein
MRCKGTSNLFDEGVGFFWWGWFVTVLNVHEVHTSAGCPKQGLRVLAAMPTMGEIGSANLCGCRFVKGKSAAQIVDKHWLDDGMSKPGRKTGQGHRQTRKGLSRNSAVKTLAACTQMRIRQRRNWQPARRCKFGSAQHLVQVRGLTWHDLKLGRRTV